MRFELSCDEDEEDVVQRLGEKHVVEPPGAESRAGSSFQLRFQMQHNEITWISNLPSQKKRNWLCNGYNIFGTIGIS